MKGILVGNGCTDWEVDAEPGWMEMLYMHNIIDINSFKEWRDNKCFWTVEEVFEPSDDPKCVAIWEKLRSNLKGLNIYDIY